jgi:hypothetical protein
MDRLDVAGVQASFGSIRPADVDLDRNSSHQTRADGNNDACTDYGRYDTGWNAVGQEV